MRGRRGREGRRRRRRWRRSTVAAACRSWPPSSPLFAWGWRARN
jgi:hypothetical protein